MLFRSMSTDVVDGRSEVEGLLAVRRVVAGTRSEHESPVLITQSESGEEVVTRVHVLEDPPFEEPTLAALLGARVRVRGTWRNGVLRVRPEEVVVVEGVPAHSPPVEGAAREDEES